MEQWQRWFGEEESAPPSKGPGKPGNRWTSGKTLIVIAVVLVLFIVLSLLRGFFTEFLWFNNLGYSSVFTTILATKIILFFIGAVLFTVIFLGSMLLATRFSPKTEAVFWPWAIVRRLSSMLRLNVLLGTGLLALIFGGVAEGNWDTVLQFIHAQPFGVTDPVFHKEVGFYVFSLPFLDLIRGWLTGALIITLLGSAAVYLLSYGVQRLRFDFSRRVMAHIGGLLALIFALFGWGYWLSIWDLVFSHQGAVFGAGYTDMHANLPAQWILMAVSVAAIIVVIVSIYRRSYRLPLYAIGAWIGIAILVGGLFPMLVQRLEVVPNEFAKEQQYIKYNIDFTRQGFALDRITDQEFAAKPTPTPQEIADNPATITNVRLWDPRPLKNTYNQLQSFRQYYDFNDVDIDRYTINGDYRQVTIAARELEADKLPAEAQTWVNRKLQFTHGYGYTMSPVNEIGTGGLPQFLEKDIPMTGVIKTTRPQIYYGEQTNDYVIVKTNTDELDYATGSKTVYGTYNGTGGVGIGSFFRRLAYAWQFGDFNILISSQLTSQSRLMYFRNIQTRVSHLAPFLRLDKDPYLVAINGGLYWIQDCYTVSDRYPYSQPKNGINYIRNSVKAVINAYNGQVTFYVTDPTDALIRTYQKIFPKMFVPMTQMPADVRAHIRYPEDMFSLQADVFRTYHMQDPRVFYNKEDMWNIPNEVYFGNQQQPVQPYYIIMKLPGATKEEFLLMLPFTPANKDIAIGWLAARSDGANYGKLLAYLFPKGETVLGPSQIENRIGQNTVITEQLALWSRGGSQVIRGNLLLIPIGQSMIFVEPIFLEADNGGLPELKRVIVATGEKLAMEPTLEQSLYDIFGSTVASEIPSSGTSPPSTGPPTTGPPSTTPPTGGVSPDMAALIQQAQQHFNQAQQYLQSGNWTGYGAEQSALEATLQELAKLGGVQ